MMDEAKRDFYETELVGDVKKITLVAVIHDPQIPDIQNALEEECGDAKVFIDLSGVSHMCSSTMGMFLHLSKQTKDKGGRLVIIRPEEQIFKLFKMLRLDDMLEFVASEEEAIKILAD